jgi:hypothetical protein
MATLNSIISGSFLKQIAATASGTNQDSRSNPLQSGSTDAAIATLSLAGERLNAFLPTYAGRLNLLDGINNTFKKLLPIAEEMQRIAEQAITAGTGTRNELTARYQSLAGDLQDIINEVEDGPLEEFSKKSITELITNMGFLPDEEESVSGLLERFITNSDTAPLVDGEIKGSRPVPGRETTVTFENLLGADVSFSSTDRARTVAHDLKALVEQIKNNQTVTEELYNSADKGLDLILSTSLTFSRAAEIIEPDSSLEESAKVIRNTLKIATPKESLSEIHNLDGIIVTALLADDGNEL